MRPESATIYSIRPRLYMSTSSSCATSTGTDYHAPQKHRKINCFSRRRRSPPPPPFPLKLDSYLFRSSHFQHANKPTPPPPLTVLPSIYNTPNKNSIKSIFTREGRVHYSEIRYYTNSLYSSYVYVSLQVFPMLGIGGGGTTT